MKAALSLDLDNKWSYMKTHGESGWESFPSYLNVVVPKALDTLREFGLRITVFVVGQDAALPSNSAVLSRIASHGHEIGNHSFHHEPWMHRRSEAEIDAELDLAEKHILRATGQTPRGFRGPGFAKSESLTRVLAARGYLYDASSLPTFIGPIARAYYFRSSKLQGRPRAQRGDLFGRVTDGLRSNRPHRIRTGNRVMHEVPVTTMPLVRLPIHISYLLYMATFSPRLALAYFHGAVRLCRLTATEPSILLHPLDFIDATDCPELAFFPAMRLDASVKRTILHSVLHILTRNFDVMPIDQFVREH